MATHLEKADRSKPGPEFTMIHIPEEHQIPPASALAAGVQHQRVHGFGLHGRGQEGLPAPGDVVRGRAWHVGFARRHQDGHGQGHC